MFDQYRAEAIDSDDFRALLQLYPEVVPEKLTELEQDRLVTIPKALAGRETAYLTKTEVQTLMEWKLGHGTFRPSLRKLVASNSEESVEEATKEAYQTYDEDKDNWMQALTVLAKLRGVGPATASLLLSVYDSARVPFFSDELFRWLLFEDAKGSGWDRKMKYSMGEYKQMFPLVEGLRERLDKAAGGDGKVSALETEMVAYVLGRRDGEVKIKRGAKRATEVDETITKEAPSSDAKETRPAADAPSTSKKRKLRSSA